MMAGTIGAPGAKYYEFPCPLAADDKCGDEVARTIPCTMGRPFLALNVALEMPGVEKNSVDISVEDGV